MRELRAFGLVVLFVFVGGLLFSGGQSEEDDRIELTFRQNDPPDEVGDLFDAIDEFNEMQDRIVVDVETVPWSDARDQYVREVQAGGGPDVVQQAFVWTAELAENDLVMNLDSMIEENPPGEGIDDFLGTDLGVVDDSVYGIPWTVDTFVMAYSPELFEEAGIDEFPDDYDWDDFFEAARILSEPDGQDGFGFPAGSGSDSGMWFLANYYLWSQDKFLVEQNDSGEWQVGVSEDDIVEAIEYFNAFFEEGITSRTMIGVDSWGNPELVGGLARGDMAISFFPPATFRAAQDQADEQLETSMVPQGSVRRISHLGGRALTINPNTEHPEAAWELLNYLLTEEVFQAYPQFPAQESLLDVLEYRPGEDGYADQLPHAITFNQYIQSPASTDGMWAAVNRNFGSVYSGERSPSEAAASLIGDIEELLED